MDIFRVEYSKLSSVAGSAKRIAKKLDSRIDDYEGINKQLNKVPNGNRNNISSAVGSIKRKNSSLEEKMNALNSFAQRCYDFADRAKNVDKQVANRINRDTDKFKKTNNIQIKFTDAIKAGIDKWIRDYFGRYGRWGREAYAGFSEKLRDLKTNIKTWYEDQGGKYIVEIIKDVALLAVSIAVFLAAPVTIIGAVFAAFGFYKSACDIGYDTAAYISYKYDGNKARADRLDASGGREFLVDTTGYILEQMEFDEDTVNTIQQGANVGYSIMEAGSIIYSAYKGGKAINKGWKSFKEMSGGSVKITDFKTNLNNLRNFKDVEKMTTYFDGITAPSKVGDPVKLSVKFINNQTGGFKKFLMDAYSFKDTYKNWKKVITTVPKTFDLVDKTTSMRDILSAEHKLYVEAPSAINRNYSPLLLNRMNGKNISSSGVKYQMITLNLPKLTQLYSVSGSVAS